MKFIPSIHAYLRSTLIAFGRLAVIVFYQVSPKALAKRSRE